MIHGFRGTSTPREEIFSFPSGRFSHCFRPARLGKGAHCARPGTVWEGGTRLDSHWGLPEGRGNPLPDRPMRHPYCLLAASCLLLSLPARVSYDWVELGGQSYSVEIADDDAERARGLMFRDRLEAGHGMLFIHEVEAPQAYWKKNTRIPLDILY